MESHPTPTNWVRCLETASTNRIIPLLLSPNVALTRCYLSSVPLNCITNKLEVEMTGEDLEKFRAFIRTLVDHSASQDALRALLSQVTDAERILVTIPISSVPTDQINATTMLSNAWLYRMVQTMYGSLMYVTLESVKTRLPSGLHVLDSTFLLPQFKVILGGVERTPCDICKLKPEKGVCVYKTRNFECLFSSELTPVSNNSVVDDAKLMAIISNTVPDLPDDYLQYIEEWYKENPDVPKLPEEDNPLDDEEVLL